MSAKLFGKDILFLQRVAKISKLYKGPLDGKWSQAVGDAEEELLSAYESIKKDLGSFDARSEKNIMTLLPKTQKKAREFLTNAAGAPFSYKIISGTRTYAEQDELYAKGRTKPGPKVTNAKGGQSLHNFSIAWDIGILKATNILLELLKLKIKLILIWPIQS